MPSNLTPLTLTILSLTLIPQTLSQYTATYTVGSLPDSSEQGQSGTNQCGSESSQSSECQNLFVNSVDDFCVWGPPSTSSNEGDGTSKIGNVEQIVVSYCLNEGYGTRLIPSGTISGAHFVKVENDEVSYVQVSGVGDFTSINIPAGDEGGELDPHSWTGLGNPQGGLVFTNAFSGSYEQTHEWTSFISATTFCVRACRDGPNAAGWCQHIYDTLDCAFTIPGSMEQGYDDCLGDPALEPGVYSGSTFSQGDPTTPAPHPAGATSMCTTRASIGGGTANLNVGAATPITTSASVSATSISNALNATSSGSSMSGSGSSMSGSSMAVVNSTSMSSTMSSTSTMAPSRISSSTSIRNSATSLAASTPSTSTSSGTSGASKTILISSTGLLGVIALVIGGLV